MTFYVEWAIDRFVYGEMHLMVIVSFSLLTCFIIRSTLLYYQKETCVVSFLYAVWESKKGKHIFCTKTLRNKVLLGIRRVSFQYQPSKVNKSVNFLLTKIYPFGNMGFYDPACIPSPNPTLCQLKSILNINKKIHGKVD